jgi:hypothetical protein
MKKTIYYSTLPDARECWFDIEKNMGQELIWRTPDNTWEVSELSEEHTKYLGRQKELEINYQRATRSILRKGRKIFVPGHYTALCLEDWDDFADKDFVYVQVIEAIAEEIKEQMLPDMPLIIECDAQWFVENRGNILGKEVEDDEA